MTTNDQDAVVSIQREACTDNDELAHENQVLLEIPRDRAISLGRETVAILGEGEYTAPSGRQISLRDPLHSAIRNKVSLPPNALLPPSSPNVSCPSLTVAVRNETTLKAARRLAAGGSRVLALNFAAATHPGGGFLSGARAQEEFLARSSGLYSTLLNDPMYTHHERHYDPMATEWAILAPDVPVFRADDGILLEEPWLCTILTCAAPYARRVVNGDPTAAMHGRIERVLSISQAYEYDALVLGAWGCGAFGNDPVAVAGFFQKALFGPFLGAFSQVIFAITDWSPGRLFLGPFRDAFA